VDIWLVCYDIGCDKRRNRLSSWLLRFGMRVQESVFEVSVKDSSHFNKLWRGVQEKNQRRRQRARLSNSSASHHRRTLPRRPGTGCQQLCHGAVKLL